MKIVSWSEAHRSGLKSYFTGKPCKYGHIAPRQTISKNCFECRKEFQKRYKKSEAWKSLMRLYSKRYVHNPHNKHKFFAQLEARKAVKNGILLKSGCEICGITNVHGHHEDYSKPLDVMWLCRKHHYARHKELKEQGVIL